MEPRNKFQGSFYSEEGQLMKIEKYVQRQGLRAELRAIKLALMEMGLTDNSLRYEWITRRLTAINNRLRELNHE